jgi:DNA-binding transcriptional MerR regulator
MGQSCYTMRQLTKELGVTARTLRHYEERKLIAPARRGQTRLYSFKDYARILIVLRGRRLGFTIAEMGEMLRMYDYKDGDAREQLLMARSRFQERIVNLRRKKSDIEESILQLSECVNQIDGALEGKPRTPWHDFFVQRAGQKRQAALLQ